MDIDKKRVVIDLEPHTVLRLSEAAGSTVSCLEGGLWITQENDRNDIVVEKGGSFVVQRNGSTLIQGLRGSRIGIEARNARLVHEHAPRARASRAHAPGFLTAVLGWMQGLSRA